MADISLPQTKNYSFLIFLFFFGFFVGGFGGKNNDIFYGGQEDTTYPEDLYMLEHQYLGED